MILSGGVVAELLPVIESQDIRIDGFTPFVTSESDGLLLTTGKLSVSGHYRNIVALLDWVERDMPYCKVVSAHYRTSRPRSRSSAKSLGCIIYIQQITTD